MKLRTLPNSTHPLISKHEVVHHTEVTRQIYDHPWDRHVRELDVYKENGCIRRSDKAVLIKPNPPSKEAVEKAKFVDKTYHWSGSLRSRDLRTNT